MAGGAGAAKECPSQLRASQPATPSPLLLGGQSLQPCTAVLPTPAARCLRVCVTPHRLENTLVVVVTGAVRTTGEGMSMGR